MESTYLKRYPLTHAISAVIVVLSLAPIPDIASLPNISMLDKWTHMVMYGTLGLVIWWEYLRQHKSVNWKHVLVGAVVMPIILGGLMELGQRYLTTCRSAEWLDFAANSVGVLLAAVVGSVGSRR